MLQQLCRTQGGHWSLPEATKDRSREHIPDPLQDPGAGGILWSLMGGQVGKWNHEETGIKQPQARQRFLLPELL